ncbi:MAG: SOS response-associated peptidase, partial [Acidimicrobiales bacterium]
LVPADAFYEWQRVGIEGAPVSGRSTSSTRQPWCFKAADGSMLALGGLWEVWRDPSRGDAEPPLFTCTILTTRANDLVRPVHDRMPVVIRPSDYESWLAPEPLDSGAQAVLLAPAGEEELIAFRVSPEVGNSRSEGAHLVVPSEEAGEWAERGGVSVNSETGEMSQSSLFEI